MLGDEMLFDRLSADEMFLNDSLDHRWIAPAVPGSFRVNDGDWPALADAQTIRFRAQDAASFREPKLFEPPLEVIPRQQRALAIATLRFRLIGAEEDMAPCIGYSD